MDLEEEVLDFFHASHRFTSFEANVFYLLGLAWYDVLKRLVDLFLYVNDEIKALIGTILISDVELMENFAKWCLLQTLEFEWREPL